MRIEKKISQSINDVKAYANDLISKIQIIEADFPERSPLIEDILKKVMPKTIAYVDLITVLLLDLVKTTDPKQQAELLLAGIKIGIIVTTMEDELRCLYKVN